MLPFAVGYRRDGRGGVFSRGADQSMYKWLLCWRYLWTRYLALASIVSVMLGVATLIVVNSVMGGFSTKLMSRLRGLRADVIIEYRYPQGMAGYEDKINKVKNVLGDRLVAVTPVIETFAILEFRPYRYRSPISQPVRVIGIDPATKSAASEFASTLQNPDYRAAPETVFQVDGELLRKHRSIYGNRGLPSGFSNAPLPLPSPPESGLPGAGTVPPGAPPADATAGPPPPPFPSTVPDLPQPDAAKPPVEEIRLFGAVLGKGIASYRKQKAHAQDEDKDVYFIEPGDEVSLMMLGATEVEGYDGSIQNRLRPEMAKFVVTDIFRSDMSEIDSNIIYIDLRDMQRLRAMPNRATSLHLRLKDSDRDTEWALNQLRQFADVDGRLAFDESLYLIQTWKDKQGALLAAIGIERAILNVLLFLIIAVAGFGILAIFFMIVVEKTRDIGILKALGASNRGVMGIFLGYGLVLGCVGSGLGTVLGITITVYINEIEQLLSKLTGQEVFPRDIYYFDKIPTDMQPLMVIGVNLGAILIAVMASIFPALRAALLHPVQALRYE